MTVARAHEDARSDETAAIATAAEAPGSASTTVEAPISNQAALLASADLDEPEARPDLVAQMGPGWPLDPQTRQRMESAFGESLARVRVHTGPEAGHVARRMSAQALTVGSHVAFAPGNYRPGTLVGDAMLAHELAHTIQQGDAPAARDGAAAGAPAPAIPAAGPAGRALESDAEMATVGAMRRLWAGPGRPATAGFSDSRPALRSALRVQRCSCSGATQPPAAAREAALPTFRPENKIATVGPGLDPEPFGGGRGVRIKPHQFFARADVWGRDGDPADAPDWTAGFIQTAFSARRIHNYRLNSDDSPALRRTNELPHPALEGEVGLPRPWYGQHESFPNFPSRVQVQMTDTPRNEAPWEDDGHQAHLASTGGSDTFGTWLVVKHARQPEPIYLTWDTWEVDWLADTNFGARTLTGLRGNGARKTSEGGIGRGDLVPVLTGPFSNDLLHDAGFRDDPTWDGRDRE